MTKIAHVIGSLVMAAALLATPVLGQAKAYDLGEVASFDNSATGYAGTESPNYEAFRAVLEQGKAGAPTLEKVLKTGSPAGKIYAALGLYNIDKARGKKALTTLTADKSKMSRMTGCMLDDTTVGAVAAELLKNGESGMRVYLPSLRTPAP